MGSNAQSYKVTVEMEAIEIWPSNITSAPTPAALLADSAYTDAKRDGLVQVLAWAQITIPKENLIITSYTISGDFPSVNGTVKIVSDFEVLADKSTSDEAGMIQLFTMPAVGNSVKDAITDAYAKATFASGSIFFGVAAPALSEFIKSAVNQHHHDPNN